MPKDLFNLEEHRQREANSAWNALVDATYKRICWVCQSQVGGDTAVQVLDDLAVWQPICSPACGLRLPGPVFRYNPDIYGVNHTLGTPYCAAVWKDQRS